MVASWLGVHRLKIDAGFALLPSLGLTLVGAALIALGGHGSARTRVVTAELMPVAPVANRIAHDRDASREANLFATANLERTPSGTIHLADLRSRYRDWASAQGMEPLPDDVIGRELATMFEQVGLRREGYQVPGVAWRDA